MTPAERIAATLGYRRPIDGVGFGVSESRAFHRAGLVLDALCPKGERVVLDRTGGTDRLVRQEQFSISTSRRWKPFLLWVDVEDGSR